MFGMLLIFFIMSYIKKLPTSGVNFHIELGLVDFLITMYVITSVRILIGYCTYTKAKYLVMVLLSLGFVFFELDINFLVPIFYSLEAGTILFIVVIIKSFINF